MSATGLGEELADHFRIGGRQGREQTWFENAQRAATSERRGHRETPQNPRDKLGPLSRTACSSRRFPISNKTTVGSGDSPKLWRRGLLTISGGGVSCAITGLADRICF